MEKHYNNLSILLNDLHETIVSNDLSNYLNKFHETDRFEKLNEQYKDLKNDLSKAINECSCIIESSIYCGVIGHYSHGKSSLLNAMIMPPKSLEILPTGDKIVTALCSLIKFEPGSNNKFFEVSINYDKKYVSQEEYQRKVAGGVSGLTEKVSHFEISIGTDNTANTELYSNFVLKKIELFDSPGLGGPYWNDEALMAQWVSAFKLIILCIRCDKIDEKTAYYVNPFLKLTAQPVIPVVTFWDIAPDSEKYKGITDELNRRKKAKEDLRRHFPSLQDAIDRTVFVSVKNYMEQQPVPEEYQSDITMDWNIDNLRKQIASFITKNRNILLSVDNEVSAIELKRHEAMIQSCKKLESTADNIIQSLNATIEKAKPGRKFEEQLENGCEKLSDTIEKEFDKITDRLEQKISDKLSLIGSKGHQEIFKEIEDDVPNYMKEYLDTRFKEKIERVIDKDIIRNVVRKIEEETPLPQKKVERLEKDLKESSKYFISDISRFDRIKPFKAPETISAVSINFISAVTDILRTMMTTKLPLLCILCLLLFIAPFFSRLLSHILNFIPGVNISSNFIMVIVYVVVFTIIFSIGQAQFKQMRDKNLIEIKERARRANRHADIRERVKSELPERFKEYQNELKELINKATEKKLESSDEMLEEFSDFILKIKTQLKDIKTEYKEIERCLR